MEKSVTSENEKYINWMDYDVIEIGELYETIEDFICYPPGEWRTVRRNQQRVCSKTIVVPVTKYIDYLDSNYFHYCLDVITLDSKTQKSVKKTYRSSMFEGCLGVPVKLLNTTSLR